MLDLTKNDNHLTKFDTQLLYLNPFNGKSQTLSLGGGKVAKCMFDKRSGGGVLVIDYGRN